MTSCRDSRGPVNVDTDISLIGEQRLPRVQTHADTELARAKSLLRSPRSRKRVVRPPERDEKRITLRVHLNPTVPRKRVSQHAPVLLEQIRIRIAQLAQQLCRPLHVGEEESDSPRGKIATHSVMMRDIAVYVTGTRSAAAPPTDSLTNFDADGEVLNLWNGYGTQRWRPETTLMQAQQRLDPIAGTGVSVPFQARTRRRSPVRVSRSRFKGRRRT